MPPPLTRPVSRIRLRVERRHAANPCRFHDSVGGPVREIPLLRLATIARIHHPTKKTAAVERENAMIDTGAWISAIRFDVWKAYHKRGMLELLPFAAAGPDPIASIAGVSTPYRLGRLRVGLLDLLGPRERAPGGPLFHELPAVPVVAQLFLDPTLDHTRMPFPVVFGLSGGVLDGRRLRREPVAPVATGLETDAGPTHAQDWFLEAA